MTTTTTQQPGLVAVLRRAALAESHHLRSEARESAPTEPRERHMTAWWITATCPECGEALIHVADGVPNGLRSRAIACCSACRRPWEVQIAITNVSKELGRPRGPRAAERGSHP